MSISETYVDLYALGIPPVQIKNAITASNAVVRPINAGVVDTASINDSFIAWKSSNAATKTQNIGPGATNQTLYIKDAIGTAATYNIVITASGCTIDGAATFPLNVNKQSVSLKWDGVSNWMIF